MPSSVFHGVLHKCGARIDNQMGAHASLKRQELEGYGDDSVGLLPKPEALSLDSPAQQGAEACVYNLSTGRGAEAGKSWVVVGFLAVQSTKMKCSAFSRKQTQNKIKWRIIEEAA